MNKIIIKDIIQILCTIKILVRGRSGGVQRSQATPNSSTGEPTVEIRAHFVEKIIDNHGITLAEYKVKMKEGHQIPSINTLGKQEYEYNFLLY